MFVSAKVVDEVEFVVISVIWVQKFVSLLAHMFFEDTPRFKVLLTVEALQ